MVELGGALGFHAKSSQRFRTALRHWNYLDRYDAIKSQISSAKDGSHSTDTDQ
jgi:hypothetical protein